MLKLFKQAPLFWYRKTLFSRVISYLLLPFALLYLAIVYIRRLCYSCNYVKVIRFPVPIIVVGNITVGGTGKTPLVIWLARLLQQQNYKVGIVSRGYGGTGINTPILVTAESDAKIVGDEALLIARQTQCPVFVAKNRVAAVEELLKHINCDMVLSDDGLQHYALGRAIEIAIVDGVRGFGNGLCLPAGPLREPVSRLKEVDFVVKNNGVFDQEGQGQYTMHFLPEKLYNLQNPCITKELSELRGMDVHAIAGIGNPANFFQLLRSHEIVVYEHVFPDHHAYVAADLDFEREGIIIMTEKDAVKCERFAKKNCWVLPIKVEVSEQFSKDLLRAYAKDSTTLVMKEIFYLESLSTDSHDSRCKSEAPDDQ